MSNRRIYYLLKLVLIGSIALPVQYTSAGINGEDIFVKNCMVCHADDGSGAMPGVADLTESREWLKLSEPQLLSRMKQGIEKPGATVPMPPKGGNPELTDDDLKAVIHYMRNTFFK